MSFTLVLNSSNYIGNNSFRYSFKTGGFSAEHAEMCVSAITIPYSWFNISSLYNNNKFTVRFPCATYLGNPYYDLSITLPDGFYSVSDIKSYIQLQCVNAGLYLINSASQNVYYFDILYSQTYYAVQIICYAIPTSLPAGYSLPTSGIYLSPGLPASSLCSQLFLPASGSISTIIGFVAGAYYPATATSSNTSILSTLTPVGSTVNSLVLQCNLVKNECTVPSDILDSMAIDGVFGANINYIPSFEKWITVKKGIYSNFTLTFSDQNLNNFYLRDPNVSITLIIRNKKS